MSNSEYRKIETIGEVWRGCSPSKCNPQQRPVRCEERFCEAEHALRTDHSTDLYGSPPEVQVSCKKVLSGGQYRFVIKRAGMNLGIVKDLISQPVKENNGIKRFRIKRFMAVSIAAAGNRAARRIELTQNRLHAHAPSVRDQRRAFAAAHSYGA